VEGIASGLSETFFEPVIRLGVTGLARSGKTVFITSLVANLLDRGRMPGLEAARSGRIEAAFLQPQPDDTVPRFAFEDHLAAMTGTEPRWPDSTRAVSELRLSLRVRPSGLLGAGVGPRTVHLDIVDYPGEWLLDLALLDLDFRGLVADALARAEARRDGLAGPFFAALSAADPTAKLAEPVAARWRAAGPNTWRPRAPRGSATARPAGSCCPAIWRAAPRSPSPRCRPARRRAARSPANSPAATRPTSARSSNPSSAPISRGSTGRSCWWTRSARSMPARRRWRTCARPWRDPRRLPAGRNAFLSSILGRRVDRILFAATKADHLHHDQHPRFRP
jgi:hypothetical protein